MDYRPLARQIYQERVKTNHTIPESLRTALKAHERVPGFIDDLARRIQVCQDRRVKDKGRPFLEATIKATIRDCVDLFFKAVQMKADKMHQSDMSKILEQTKAQEIKDMEATIAGKPSGVFEEMGVKTNDSRDETFETKTRTAD